MYSLLALPKLFFELISGKNIEEPGMIKEILPKPPNLSFVAETNLPTIRGIFRVRSYRLSSESNPCMQEPLAIIIGNIEGKSDVPLRVHDQCFTSEVLGSMKCDCQEQLDFSLQYIKQHTGIVIYLQQEGRGIGLANKIAAYSLQEVTPN